MSERITIQCPQCKGEAFRLSDGSVKDTVHYIDQCLSCGFVRHVTHTHQWEDNTKFGDACNSELCVTCLEIRSFPDFGVLPKDKIKISFSDEASSVFEKLAQAAALAGMSFQAMGPALSKLAESMDDMQRHGITGIQVPQTSTPTLPKEEPHRLITLDED